MIKKIQEYNELGVNSQKKVSDGGVLANILIVAANFYQDIANELQSGARTYLASRGATFEEITVAGAFEIPSAIALALESGKYDGFVALGCVIRGETTHYDYVCGESARGIMELNINHKACIGYGILTVENMEQALTRARISEGNKGRDAAEACLQLVELKNKFS